MPRLLILIFFASQLSNKIIAQDIRFSMPLKGEQGKDYFIGFYVDHDSTPGWKDAHCGSKTYDGHKGTDFFLRSFKTMDSGVYIYAAADGVVYSVRDGNFDRNKNLIKSNLNYSNYIEINHGGKFYSYYFHIAKYSPVVRVGDSVKRGQAIARVGSSGFASNPHLHFEVWDNDHHLVDPFSGNCQAGGTMWVSEPKYDSAVTAFDAGFIPYVPNLDTLKERYQLRDTFFSNTDTVVCFWIQLLGIHKGDKNRVEWYNPHGRLFNVSNYTWPTSDDLWKFGNWWSYTWHWMKMPDVNGKYIAKFFVNNTLIVSRNFYVTKHVARY